jgi:hypothetical protein
LEAQVVVLTSRDEAVLYLLAHKLRACTLEQLAQAFFGGSVEAARKRVRRLANAGVLSVFVRLVPPMPAVTAPLAVLRPGEDLDCGPLLYLAQKRLSLTCVPTRVIQATSRGANRMGGSTRSLRLAESAHDLLTSAVFFVQPPPRQADWRGEEAFEARGDCVPDAFLPQENVVIEVVGSAYKRDKIEKLVACCALAERQYRLELW